MQSLQTKQQKINCLNAIMPVVELRKNALLSILQQACEQDIPAWQIDLAQQDLLAALKTLCPDDSEAQAYE